MFMLMRITWRMIYVGKVSSTVFCWFPGRQALYHLTNGWKYIHRMDFHDSGWITFKFDSVHNWRTCSIIAHTLHMIGLWYWKGCLDFSRLQRKRWLVYLFGSSWLDCHLSCGMIRYFLTYVPSWVALGMLMNLQLIKECGTMQRL